LRVFDAALLAEIAQELLATLPESPAADPRLRQLGRVVTAVDGTLLRALPQVTQACFGTRHDHGWRMHAQFEVLRGAVAKATVTDASGRGEASEKQVLREQLEAGRCYVMDRGYEQFSLFNAIRAAGSDYVCRVRNDHVFQAERTAALSADAEAAGVRKMPRVGSVRRTPSGSNCRTTPCAASWFAARNTPNAAVDDVRQARKNWCWRRICSRRRPRSWCCCIVTAG
jgi:hypothetical protein